MILSRPGRLNRNSILYMRERCPGRLGIGIRCCIRHWRIWMRMALLSCRSMRRCISRMMGLWRGRRRFGRGSGSWMRRARGTFDYMSLLATSGVDWNRVGQPMNSAETLKSRLEACGFVDVRDDVYKVRHPSSSEYQSVHWLWTASRRSLAQRSPSQGARLHDALPLFRSPRSIHTSPLHTRPWLDRRRNASIDGRSQVWVVFRSESFVCHDSFCAWAKADETIFNIIFRYFFVRVRLGWREYIYGEYTNYFLGLFFLFFFLFFWLISNSVFGEVIWLIHLAILGGCLITFFSGVIEKQFFLSGTQLIHLLGNYQLNVHGCRQNSGLGT